MFRYKTQIASGCTQTLARSVVEAGSGCTSWIDRSCLKSVGKALAVDHALGPSGVRDPRRPVGYASRSRLRGLGTGDATVGARRRPRPGLASILGAADSVRVVSGRETDRWRSRGGRICVLHRVDS